MSWRSLLRRSKTLQTRLTSITPDGYAAEHVLDSRDDPWLTAMQLRQAGHRQVRLHQRMPLGLWASVEVVELVEADPARVPGLRRDRRGRYAVGSISVHVRGRQLWRTLWHPAAYRSAPEDEVAPLPSWLAPAGVRAAVPQPAGVHSPAVTAWPLLESLARAKADAAEQHLPFEGPVRLTRAQCEALHLDSGAALPDDWEDQLAAGLPTWTVLGYPVVLVHADDDSTPWAHGWRG